MIRKVCYFVFALIILMGAGVSQAQVPQLINYQGYITDSSGTPIHGLVSILFGIHNDSTGGTLLWSETQNVDVSDGFFSVLLGSETAIPYSVFNDSLTYLELTVGSDPPMTPRKRLVSVGYAFHANDSDSLAGYDASSFVRSVDGVSPNIGNIDLVEGSNITITPDDVNNQITISAAGGAKGGITEVIAGKGLTGSSSSGSVTLDVGAGTGISVGTDAVSLASDYVDGSAYDSRFVNHTGPESVYGSSSNSMFSVFNGGSGYALFGHSVNSAGIYGYSNNNWAGLLDGKTKITGKLDVGGPVSIGSTGVALRVNGAETLWYNGTYFSWGYGGSLNYFADKVGIGTYSTSYKLHVIGSIVDVSDIRLKEKITPLENALEKVFSIRSIYFNNKGESSDKREVGVIAQEVEEVLPEAVSEDNEGYKYVDYTKLTSLLIEAVKEQQAQIIALKVEISDLKTKVR